MPYIKIYAFRPAHSFLCMIWKSKAIGQINALVNILPKRHAQQNCPTMSLLVHNHFEPFLKLTLSIHEYEDDIMISQSHSLCLWGNLYTLNMKLISLPEWGILSFYAFKSFSCPLITMHDISTKTNTLQLTTLANIEYLPSIMHNRSFLLFFACT